MGSFFRFLNPDIGVPNLYTKLPQIHAIFTHSTPPGKSFAMPTSFSKIISRRPTKRGGKVGPHANIPPPIGLTEYEKVAETQGEGTPSRAQKLRNSHIPPGAKPIFDHLLPEISTMLLHSRRKIQGSKNGETIFGGKYGC